MASGHPAFIAIFDFGTSSGRCLLIDPQGKVLACSQVIWNYQNLPYPDGPVWSFDPAASWLLLAKCCQEAIDMAGARPQDALGVVATSQRHGAVLTGCQNEGLDAIPNMDIRSTPEWDALAKSHADRIYHITGRWPQRVFLPAHLSWIRANKPDEFHRIGHLLSIPDWIVYCLCGEMVSEPTTATDLLLLDMRTRQWSTDLLELFGIRAEWMPAIVPSGTIAGKLQRSAAQQTGLPEGIPVIIGGADTQLGVLGLGCIRPNALAVIMGSSAPLQVVIDHPRQHPDAALWTNPHVTPDQWVIESNAGDSGLLQDNLLRNIAETFAQLGPSTIDARQLMKDLDYELYEHRDRHQARPIASLGPMIFHAKNWPVVHGVIKGIDLTAANGIQPVDLYYALIENIAYAIRGNFLQLKTMVQEFSDVRAGGGAMNSPLWQNFLPTVLNTSFDVPDEKEATSIGAALLGFVNLGVHRTLADGIQSMIRFTTFHANQGEQAEHDHRYQKWLEVYQQSLGSKNGNKPS